MLEKSTGQPMAPQVVRTAPIDDDEIDLLQLAGTIWRGKWVVAFCAALAVLAGGYYGFAVAVPKYSATASLALEVRDSQVVDLESVLSGVSTETSAINTEIEVMRSRLLLERLVTELDLTTDPEFNGALVPVSPRSRRGISERISALLGQPVQAPVLSDADVVNGAVSAVRRAITIDNPRNTYVFNITAKTGSSDKSARIANALARIYTIDQVELKYQATENAVAWLSERVAALEQELREKENAIKEVRAQSELISAASLAALNVQAKEVRDRRAEMQSVVDASVAMLARIDAALEVEDVTVKEEAVASPLIDRLANEFRQGDATALTRIDAELIRVRARARVDLDRNAQQLAALQQSYDRLQERFDSQSAELVQLQQLEREAEATRVLYETFLTRLKETAVQRGLQQADSRILSLATPGRLVEPRKLRIMALCFMLGALVGVGIVLMRQFMNNAYRTSEELETDTGVAVLGQIPKIPVRKRVDTITYLANKPTSAAAEAVRNLRTSVLLSDIDSPPQIIMSTSALPGEGKTTQSIALAMNLSGLGKRVLLIECDIRRRTFNQYFKARGERGLLSVLSREKPIEEVVFHEETIGADVLMGEKSSVNAADILSSERFGEFLNDIRERYDFIVIDTPPVLVVPDSRVIGQSVDAILFSVRWDSTSRAQVQEGLRQFSNVNLRVTGLVLAQIDPKRMKRYGYGGRYGAYSRYGYGKGYYEA